MTCQQQKFWSIRPSPRRRVPGYVIIKYRHHPFSVSHRRKRKKKKGSSSCFVDRIGDLTSTLSKASPLIAAKQFSSQNTTSMLGQLSRSVRLSVAPLRTTLIQRAFHASPISRDHILDASDEVFEKRALDAGNSRPVLVDFYAR